MKHFDEILIESVDNYYLSKRNLKHKKLKRKACSIEAFERNSYDREEAMNVGR